MAGHTNVAFRTLVRQLGSCGLVCSELLSSSALEHHPNSRRTLELFDWSERERPFAVQLFGSDPKQMARAAQLVEQRGAPVVDINMGCWVPKVAKKGHGAALLDDLPRAEAVVRAVCLAVKVPVTVKVRVGFRRGEPTAVPFALAALDAGVQMITVHGRFAEDGFSGESDRELIAEVVRAVQKRVPVICNGDIIDPVTAREALEATGCQGLMIGREALRRPWLFRELALALGLQSADSASAPRNHPLEVARRHARLARELIDKPEPVLVRELRGQLLPYRLGAGERDRAPAKGPAETRLRALLVSCQTFSDLERFFEEAQKELEELAVAQS